MLGQFMYVPKMSTIVPEMTWLMTFNGRAVLRGAYFLGYGRNPVFYF